jgi:hypothetical protein
VAATTVLVVQEHQVKVLLAEMDIPMVFHMVLAVEVVVQVLLGNQ